MTNQQKQALAFSVATQAAKLIEFWSESIRGYHQDLAGIDPEEARAQIRKWMLRLPTGDSFPATLCDGDE